ncbi:MAG: ComF family protein [Eubacteriales bacterium]|nr:ComF family protein [Eubacteriales bacterium]
MREAIHRIKYSGKREYLEVFGQLLTDRMGEQIGRWNPQAVLAVPMHRLARKKRGFNQAEVLAQKVSEETGIPTALALIKTRRTGEQKSLGRQERRRNLRAAFSVKRDFLEESDQLPWSRVLLVDDVYTTGSTVDAVSDVLRSYGVEEIYVLTLCTGHGIA